MLKYCLIFPSGQLKIKRLLFNLTIFPENPFFIIFSSSSFFHIFFYSLCLMQRTNQENQVLIRSFPRNTLKIFSLCYIMLLILKKIFTIFSVQLYAKEASTKIPEISTEQISFDNRVRQFGTPDQIFNYFSSIQLVNKFGKVYFL